MEFRIKTKSNSALSGALPGEKRAFLDAVEQHCISKQRGENGAPEYTNEGLGSALLSINQMVRGADPGPTFRSVLKDGSPGDVALLVVLVFATRNARGGKGERKLSYDMMLELLREMPATGLKLVPLFPHFGCFKDVFLLMELVKNDPSLHSSLKVKFSETCTKLLSDQLRSDIEAMEKHEDETKSGKTSSPPRISLLAKWLPTRTIFFGQKDWLRLRLCQTLLWH